MKKLNSIIKKFGIVLLMMTFVLSMAACDMNGKDYVSNGNDVVDDIKDDYIRYTNDYMGLQEGFIRKSSGKREVEFFIGDNLFYEDIEEYTDTAIVEKKDDYNGAEEFVVWMTENNVSDDGVIYHKEGDYNYFLAGWLEEDEKHYFSERYEMLDGMITKGDKLIMPLDFQFEEYDEDDEDEFIIEPIILEAVNFEQVTVEAGEFMAWRLVGDEQELIVDEEMRMDIVEMKTWFVPYLGGVKGEIVMEMNSLDPEAPFRGDIEIEYELVEYSD